ncbi:GreA/GreB family elongation factor [Mycobacterium angelicum]|uniref:Transcription elongation factor GreAB n=1 Tax=Mycobacterium angelicum TaxID=470074 RepID=A0A1W9ZT03_MYCAN|nr:GreA/GreB family elongation factor [Mycobacterium angelicum]MCV7196910.1 GreA/GreB family elongation factor [Mycobacterium angelicum]ORA20825.1 transcription elongation factor GreAB [Mycobacterium angelicum]
MTDARCARISPQAYERLKRELATLRQMYSGPVADGGADESKAAVQRAWRLRIKRIQDLLVNAAVGEDRRDEATEPGTVLTVPYDDTADTEVFLLRVRGAERGDVQAYSNRSPLGAAIEGARSGARRMCTLPSGADVTVTLLKAGPYGVRTAGGV